MDQVHSHLHMVSRKPLYCCQPDMLGRLFCVIGFSGEEGMQLFAQEMILHRRHDLLIYKLQHRAVDRCVDCCKSLHYVPRNQGGKLTTCHLRFECWEQHRGVILKP